MISAWIGSFLFFCIMILYVLLAFGFPFGEFAMGGKYRVLPRQLRIACAISVIIQLFAVLVLLQVGGIVSIGLSGDIAKVITYFFAFYLCINTLLNAASKSKKEKLVMAPLSAVTAFCFFYTVILG